jgi:hypothetical protein
MKKDKIAYVLIALIAAAMIFISLWFGGCV